MNSSTTLPIVLVDGELHFLAGLKRVLQTLGFVRIITVADAHRVAATLAAEPVGAVVLEPAMPFVNGRTFLRDTVTRFPDVPVVILTVVNDLHMAVECMRAGAFDYLVKPVEQSRLASALRRALGARQGRSLETHDDEPATVRAAEFDAIVTQSRAMLALFSRIEAIAPSPRPVLIVGESGTGKELVAEALHRLSRRPGPLITVNVAGLDDNLFADTLFGHARGAFTSAERSREGLVESAVDGTILLDEVGDLSAASQVKLLRLLQNGSYYALGADIPRQSRARVVAATNCDVDEAVARGLLRRDLYYRLRTHHLQVPPLRARLDDLPLLVSHFVDAAARALNKSRPRIPPELLTLLRTYSFPGNVRELEAMVFDAVALSDGSTVSLRSFKQMLVTPAATGAGGSDSLANLQTEPRLPTLREAEAALIAEALARANGNQAIAAAMLGLSRQALNKRLSRRKALPSR